MPVSFRSLLAGAVAAAAVVGASAAMAAPSSSQAITGPDVSSYQHPNGAAINWSQVAKSGVSFAIVKATEGTGYTNPYYASDYAGIADAGLVHGAYHFARPALPVAKTAAAQANYFVSAMGDSATAKTLAPSLDLEVSGGLGRSQLIRWAQDFLIDVRKATDRTPLIYTYPTFWTDTLGDPAAFSRYPVWMASYSSTQPSGFALWQYTSQASLRGIQGNVDMSRYLGESPGWTWASLTQGNVATPFPRSAPAAPVNVHATLTSQQDATVSWLPGDAGSAPITGYAVTSSNGDTEDVSAGATSATMSGLQPGLSTTFTVTANNQVGAGTPSAPSNAVEPLVATTLVGSATKSAAVGQPVVVSGTLTKARNHSPLSGQPVQLEREVPGSTAWQPVATLTTDSQGQVASSRKPHKNTSWQLVYPGGGRNAGSSATATTAVKPTVTAAFSPATVASGAWAHLTGALKPVTQDVLLTRQVYSNGAWTSVQHRTFNAGSFTLSFRAPTAPGQVKCRVLVAAAGGRSGAHSAPVTLTVSAASASKG